MYSEMVMVSLRTMWGVDITNIEKRFGAEMRSRFEAIASNYISRGLMAKSDNNFKITESGIMLSDSIIRDLMYVECEA